MIKISFLATKLLNNVMLNGAKYLYETKAFERLVKLLLSKFIKINITKTKN